MAWTSPKTFVGLTALPALDLNIHLRDNLLHLYAPPTAEIISTTAYSTTSASYVDIDASLQASIVTTGGRLLIVANMVVTGSNHPIPRYLLDGAVITSSSAVQTAGYSIFVHWTTVLAAGTHVIKPQWYSNTGTITMSLYHITVREVS
jgi:hypothetical protein